MIRYYSSLMVFIIKNCIHTHFSNKLIETALRQVTTRRGELLQSPDALLVVRWVAWEFVHPFQCFYLTSDRRNIILNKEVNNKWLFKEGHKIPKDKLSLSSRTPVFQTLYNHWNFSQPLKTFKFVQCKLPFNMKFSVPSGNWYFFTFFLDFPLAIKCDC